MLIRAISIVRRKHFCFNIQNIHRTTITLGAIYFSSLLFFFQVSSFHSWYLYGLLFFQTQFAAASLLYVFFFCVDSLTSFILYSLVVICFCCCYFYLATRSLCESGFSLYLARDRTKTTTLCPIDFHTHSLKNFSSNALHIESLWSAQPPHSGPFVCVHQSTAILYVGCCVSLSLSLLFIHIWCCYCVCVCVFFLWFRCHSFLFFIFFSFVYSVLLIFFLLVLFFIHSILIMQKLYLFSFDDFRWLL